jgi:hypothetical protein
MTSQLLYDFVKSDCTNHSDNTLMRIVFLKLQIKVTPEPWKPRIPEAECVSGAAEKGM